MANTIKIGKSSLGRRLKTTGGIFVLLFAVGALALLLRSFAASEPYNPEAYCLDHVIGSLYGGTGDVLAGDSEKVTNNSTWTYNSGSKASADRFEKCARFLNIGTVRRSGSSVRLLNFPLYFDYNTAPSQLMTQTEPKAYQAFLTSLIEVNGDANGKLDGAVKTVKTDDGVVTNDFFARHLDAISQIASKAGFKTHWVEGLSCAPTAKTLSASDVVALIDNDKTNDPVGEAAICTDKEQISDLAQLPFTSCDHAPAGCSATSDTFSVIDATLGKRTAAEKAAQFVPSKKSLKPADYERTTKRAPIDLLRISVKFNKSATPTTSISEVKRVNAYLPRAKVKDPTHTLEVLDASGKVIASQAFSLSTIANADPPSLPGEKAPPINKVDLGKANDAVLVPWAKDAALLRVKDINGSVVASQPLATPPPPSGAADYSVLTTDSAPVVTDIAPAPPGKMTVAVIGSGYPVGSGQFVADVNSFSSTYFSIEPYKSRRGQINIVYADNNQANLGCTRPIASIPRYLVCDPGLVKSALTARGIPFDTVLVLVNDSVYGGGGGVLGSDVATAYNGSGFESMSVHEMGHSFGALIDEYVLYTDVGPMTGTPNQNCFAGTPPYSGWDVATASYSLSCYYPNYYRPDPSNIMLTLGSLYFDQPSQVILNAKIDSIAGPLADSSPPTVSISSPSSGSTVTAGQSSILATASDNLGIARVAFYVDDVMVGTGYISPFTTTWDTTGLTGSHVLKAKAFDVKSNIAWSAPVTINISSGPLSAQISYPAYGSVVSGTTSITTMLSGSQAANVNKVKFFVDGVLTKTSTAAPNFPISWNTATTTDGMHSIYVQASTASGTTAASNPVTVTVSNTVAPTPSPTPVPTPTPPPASTPTPTPVSTPIPTPVPTPGPTQDTTPPYATMIAPLSGATVQGAVSLETYATDQSGISRVDFYIDGYFAGSDTAAPYSIAWASTSVADGSHYLVAIAYDASTNMNAAVTGSIMVTVDNIADTDTIPPSVPANVTLTAHGPRSLALLWSPSSDPGGVVSVYNIYLNGSFFGTISSPTNAYNVTGLSPQTSYNLSVSAVDNSGNESAKSTPLTATTDADIVPGGLAGDINGNGKVEINEVVIIMSWWKNQTIVTGGISSGDTSGNRYVEMSEVIAVLRAWQQG